MFMVNFLNPKLCFLQFIIRVLCLFLQIFSKAILKKKCDYSRDIFFVETTRVISLPFLGTVACTTRDRCLFNKQYLFTFNHRCSGCWWQYLTIEENWNNKHWTKTTGNRQHRRMITVTVHNYRLAKY